MTGYYRSPGGGLYRVYHNEDGRLTVRDVHTGDDTFPVSIGSCSAFLAQSRLTRIHAPVYIEEREEDLIARLT